MLTLAAKLSWFMGHRYFVSITVQNITLSKALANLLLFTKDHSEI